MAEPILKVKNLNVELGKEKVLEDLDFDLAEKEMRKVKCQIFLKKAKKQH